MTRIFLSGEVGKDITLEKMRLQLESKSIDKSLFVHVNSNGGDVTEGWAIYDELRSLSKNSVRITTINDGLCASMGSVILMAGDEILMRPNSKLMIHNPWGQAMGDAKEIKKYVSFIESEEKRLANFYSSKTGIELSDIVNLMDNETWMNAEEAIKKGFVSGYEQLKAVALLNKQAKMNESQLTAENKSWLKEQFEALAKVFKKAGVKAMTTLTVVTDDGTIPLYIDSDDGEIEGKNAYTDESMETPASQGIHKLEDGREITVSEGGVIESVSEEAQGMEDDELEAMKKENQAMKEELEAMKKDKEETVAKMEEKDEALAKAQSSMQAIMAMVEGKTSKPKTRGVDDSATRKKQDSSLSPIEASLRARANK